MKNIIVDKTTRPNVFSIKVEGHPEIKNIFCLQNEISDYIVMLINTNPNIFGLNISNKFKE